MAFRALHSEDRMLRGLALEYLESHVSPEIVSQLRRWRNLRLRPEARAPQQVWRN